jgi:glutaredoxin-related protein
LDECFNIIDDHSQLYIKGELIGGLDIMKEMVASGDLAEMLPKTGTLEER